MSDHENEGACPVRSQGEADGIERAMMRRRMTPVVEYLEAIDHLLGFVGREVLVSVGDAEQHPGFVVLNGTLLQGDPEVFGMLRGTLVRTPRRFAEDDNPVSFFAVGESGNAGLYIYRNEFVGASYDAEDERLTIWLGRVAITVEPKGY